MRRRGAFKRWPGALLVGTLSFALILGGSGQVLATDALSSPDPKPVAEEPTAVTETSPEDSANENTPAPPEGNAPAAPREVANDQETLSELATEEPDTQPSDAEPSSDTPTDVPGTSFRAANGALHAELTVSSDGTATFDTDDEAGHDSSANNGIVRVNDTFVYKLEYVVGATPATNFVAKIVLPKGVVMDELPGTCGPGSNRVPTSPLDAVKPPYTRDSIDQLEQQVITCALGDQSAGSTASIALTAKLTNLARQGQKFAPTEFSYKSNENPVHTVVTGLPEITASTKLDWDVSKNTFFAEPNQGYVSTPVFAQCPWNRQLACLRTTYNVLLMAPNGGKGVMPAVGDIVVTDDLTPESLYPQLVGDTEKMNKFKANLQKYGSRLEPVSNNFGIPGSKIGITENDVVLTAQNAVRDSGKLTIAQPGGPGTPATLTFQGADLSLLTSPTETARGQLALDSSKAYAISQAFHMFTPVDTIRDFGLPDLKDPNTTKLSTINRFTGLSIQGFDPSDTMTQDSDSDSNDYRNTIQQISFNGGFSKFFVGVAGREGNTPPTVFSPGDRWVGEGLPGGGRLGKGFQTVAPTQEVISLLQVMGPNPTVNVDDSMVLCDSWDNTKLHLKKKDWPGTVYATTPYPTGWARSIGSNGDAVWISGYNNVPNPKNDNSMDATRKDQVPEIRVQYSPTPGGKGSKSRCGTETGPWYDDPGLVPGNDQSRIADGVYTGVARVRVHTVLPKAAGPFNSLAFGTRFTLSIGMEVAPNLTPGTIIPNWGGIKRHPSDEGKILSLEEVLADTKYPWTDTSYDPGATIEGGHAGSRGDRIIAGDVQARIAKKVRKGTEGAFTSTPPRVSGGDDTTPGDVIQYELSPSLISNAMIQSGNPKEVWIEDCLPDASAFVKAEPQPTLVATGKLPDDHKLGKPCAPTDTYIRWVFPAVEPNVPWTPIVVTTEALPTASPGSYVNSAQIWAQDESSLVSQRVSEASISLSNKSGMKVAKIALTPELQVNADNAQTKDVHKWRVLLVNNNDPNAAAVTDPVMIDVLPKRDVNGTTYHGEFNFFRATAVDPNVQIQYTSAPSDTIKIPSVVSAGENPDITWCDAPKNGAPIIGNGACPASLEEVTGLRIVRPGTFSVGQTIDVEVDMVGSGNLKGESYINAVGAYAQGLKFPVGPVKRKETTISSSIADRFFIDANGNGVEDQNEEGVPNAQVRLTGIDDLGNQVDVTVTTEADGSYVIPNLRASNAAGYSLTFTIPENLKNDKYEFTTTATRPASAKIDKDSNADGAGVAAGIVLAPGEARVDIDAGIVKPSIGLVKSISHDVVRENDEVTYTFTATNDGSAVLHDVTLNEDAFTNGAGQDIRLHSGPTFDPTKSTGTLESMAPGAKLVWTGTYTVKATDLVLGKNIDNTASVTGKSPRDTEVRDEDNATVPPYDDGAYKVAKTSLPAAGSIDPGTDITYSIIVKHVGNLTVKNASLEDDLTGILSDATEPRNITVTTQGGTGAQPGTASVQGNKLVWNGDLVRDQEVTITYTVTSKVGTNNKLINRVEPTNPKGSCDDELGCTVTHTFNPGKYTIRKDAEIRGKTGAVAQVGDIIDYTVTVKHASGTKVNAGFRDDLSDVLDDAVLLGDPVVEPALGTAKVNQNTLTWSSRLLPTQEVKVKYSVRVTGDNNLTLTNIIVPTTKCGECDDGAEHCTTTHTTPKGKYQYAKNSPTDSPVKSGQDILYTVTVKHTEGAPVKGAEIRDELPLPDHTHLVGEVTTVSNKADTVSPATVSDTNVLTWKGNLLPGEVITISYKLHVDVNDGATLRNLVTSPDPDGERHSCEPKAGEDDQCETIHEVIKGKYHYWKTSDPVPSAVVKTGDKILYTLHISHNGGDRVKNAVVEDDLTPLLANAVYAGDAVVTNGIGVLESDPQRPNVIIWKGDLTDGQTAEVTIPVTVTATGGATLTNTLTSPDPDRDRQQCKDGLDQNCTVTHTQEKGAFVYSKTAHVGDKLSNNGAVKSGDRIDYTITVKHASGDAIPAAKISDTIASILDNAEGNALVADSLVATSTVKDTPAQPVLGDDKVITWTGDLAEQEVVTIKYAMIVDAAASATLRNAVTTPEGEDRGTCDTTEGKVCQTENSVEGGKYAYSKTSDVQELVTGVPGKEGRVLSETKITYTLNVAHTSGDRIKGATITDDFSAFVKSAEDQSKPAVYNDDAKIVSGPGAVSVENNVLTWTGDLAQGEATVITFSVTVDAEGSADLLNKVISNDPQTGRHSCVEPTDEDKDPCQTRHIVEQGKYLVTKTGIVKNGDTVKPGESAVAGDEIVYTLTATHRSGDRVKAAGFTDDFASILEHVDFKSATLVGPGELTLNDQNAPTSLSWAGTLEPGQSATVTLTVTVKAATQVDKFTNTVTPKPGDPRGECPEGQCSVDNSVPDGKFVVKKSSSTASPVKTDDTINYTIVVKHSEGTRIADATIEDILPEGVVYNGDAVASAGTVTPVDGKLQWSGDVAVGQVVTIDYSVTVGAADNGATLVNVVKPTNPKGSCEGPEDEECTTTHTVEPGKFVFEKDATMPRIVKSGDQIDYTIVVKHKSGNSLTSAKIKDDLSSVLANAAGKKLKEGSLKTVSSVQEKTPAQATVNVEGLLTWDGSLAVDEVVTITYSVTVDAPNAGATLVNQVVPGDGETKGHCEDPEDPECKTEHTVQPGKFTVAKTQDKPRIVMSGDVITYTVTVTHVGGDRVKGAHIRDVLTRVLNAATWNGDHKVTAKFMKEGVETAAESGELTYDEATKTLDWKGDLHPNQVVTITYSVTVNAQTSAQLVNVVTAPGNDGACVENCSTNNEVKAGKFTFNKTQDKSAIVKSGDIITYTVVVKHKEGDRILGAQINDDLSKVVGNAELNIPAAAKWNDDLKVSAKFVKDGVESDAPAGEAKLINDHTLNWKGDLHPNQVVTITYSVTVDTPGAAALVNSVTTPDGNGDCEENCVTLNEVPLGKYVFNKTSDPANMSQVKPGQKITYTVKIKHKEGDRVLGANVLDDLKGVLSAADWNNEVTATSVIRRGGEESEAPAGAVVFDPEAQQLNWVGNLAIGQEVTITYTVTVKDNNVNTLKNVVTTPDTEERGTCEENCETTHTPAGKYAYSKTSEAVSGSTVKTGDTIKYTLTVKHVSGESVKGASIQDNLTELLTKATYNNDAVASAGKVSVTDGVLNWTGDLAKDEAVTVVFTVKVTADGPATLVNKVTSEDPEKHRHSCVGPEDKECTTTHTVEPKPTPKEPEPKVPTPEKPTPSKPNPKAPGKLASTGMSGALVSTAALTLAGGLLFVAARRRRND